MQHNSLQEGGITEERILSMAQRLLDESAQKQLIVEAADANELVQLHEAFLRLRCGVSRDDKALRLIVLPPIY
jgi:hypothetical protein